MLNAFPEEFWTKPHTVSEPCCGKGGFVIDIIDRFLKGGLSMTTILEECIHFADINSLNIFVTSLLVDPEKKYKLNSYLGNTLEMEFPMRFDAVIANPPYNANQTSKGNTPLYNKFVEKFIDESHYCMFVIPSRWFVGGKGLDKFRTMMMNRTDIKLIEHTDNASKRFENVSIEGGVSYFLKDSDHSGVCLFNGVEYDLSKYDRIINPKYHAVIEMVKNLEGILSIYNPACYFKYRTNDKRLKKSGKITCYVSYLKSKDRKMYLDDYEFNDKNTFWKVITARANGNSGKFGIVFVGSPQEVHTDSYISFAVNSEKEAKFLKTYLETSFINALLSIRKISQDINKSTIRWIPMVPLDREWTDEKVFEHFGFSDEQITMIRALY